MDKFMHMKKETKSYDKKLVKLSFFLNQTYDFYKLKDSFNEMQLKL